ncbi:MAG: PAS domain-containing protein, partial [Actinobacteria bacterium]|nr:PAS domain-containing protein [Actinomycetota bacterium]
MTPPGHWPATDRYRSFRERVGEPAAPPRYPSAWRTSILEIAPNDPVLDSGLSQALLFDANPLAMWVHDPDTLRFLAVNEAAQRQYG